MQPEAQAKSRIGKANRADTDSDESRGLKKTGKPERIATTAQAEVKRSLASQKIRVSGASCEPESGGAPNDAGSGASRGSQTAER